MNVLITGGGGFLGSHLADFFIERGDTVTCLDLGSTRKVGHLLQHPQFRYVPDSILNVNINGTQNVLRVANKYGKKVVFSSTSEVYGRNPRVPWSEDDDRVLGSTRIDRWCYSTSKAAGEHFCFAYGRLGLPVVILRYFNIYGPRL